jgi:hypothetical protein
MLSEDAAFPFAGSYCLFRDYRLAAEERRPELARILERGVSVALISLPLRIGAESNLRVPLDDLIDGTPLTKAEDDELKKLKADLKTRRRNRAAAEKRHKALRDRAVWSACLRAERAKLALNREEQRRKAA